MSVLPFDVEACPSEVVVADYDASFDELFALAYRVSYRIVGSSEDADDLASETMAKAWLSWRRVHSYASTWVAHVSANAAVSALRRRAVRNRILSVPSRLADPYCEQRQDLVRSLRRLPRRQREVVVLRYLADLPEQVVAEALGCSVGAVKQHAHRALKALQSDEQLREGNQ